MAVQPKHTTPSKKHLARMQKEALYRRYLLITMGTILVLIIGILLYGFLQENVLDARQPIAKVDDQNITTQEWQDWVRFQRANLISNGYQIYNFASSIDDPSFSSSFAGQLQQLKAQAEPLTIGDSTINQLVDDIVIRKEAEKRGITLNEEDIQRAVENAFGYFPEGTLTPSPTAPIYPTSTLSPLQLTLLPPTATPSPTEVITATAYVTTTATATATLIPTPTEDPNPTATLVPTATPDSLEGMETYQVSMENFNQLGIINAKFREIVRKVITAQLYREKLIESVSSELSITPTEQQIWARHILVEEESIANVLYERLQSDEDFCKLAAEFSTDSSNKDNCGDLNWFGSGKMVPEFEAAAFSLEIGEISEPVKTQLGYHLIQLLGNEVRPVADTTLEQQKETLFTQWLETQKANYIIEVFADRWQDRVPTSPPWPPVFDEFIGLTQQGQQPIIEVTPVP